MIQFIQTIKKIVRGTAPVNILAIATTLCLMSCSKDKAANGGGGGNEDCEGSGGVESWIADGWCDSSNNMAACSYDGGDCCPGDCVDATYDCATYGGTCDTCADPDSGDLQSLEMLEAIAEVARQTPEVKHWLPTKEYGIYPTLQKYQSYI